MFGLSKHHWIVTITSIVLLSMAATGAMSRRMQLAAKTALFSSTDNSVDTSASTPITPHSNPAFAHAREHTQATVWGWAKVILPVEQIVVLELRSLVLWLPGAVVPARPVSLQNCLVRLQV